MEQILDHKTKKHRFSFFLIMGLVGFGAVLIGFSKTFILPITAGTFNAPFSIHLHGTFAFSWIILFITQTFLIHFRNYRTHIILGVLGIFIALGTATTMLPAGMFQVQNEGGGEAAISTIGGVFTSTVIFLSLVAAGIINRKNPAAHKRLMLLATIEVLWVAWWRFRHYFPPVPHTEIWFGVVLPDSLIVIAWIWDKRVNGKIHTALLYVGAFMIAEDVFEVLAYDSAAWRAVAKWIYGLLSGES